jgi:hypothetical protein
MESIVRLINEQTATAIRQTTLPDPTVTGPCQAQAHWTCTGQARGEHLNPLAMLPGSEVPADYVPMCQPCKDHLSDAYVTALHS